MQHCDTCKTELDESCYTYGLTYLMNVSIIMRLVLIRYVLQKKKGKLIIISNADEKEHTDLVHR